MIKTTKEGIEISGVNKPQIFMLPNSDYHYSDDILFIYKTSYIDCKIISDNKIYIKIEDDDGILTLYEILVSTNEIDYTFIAELSDFTYEDYQDLSLDIELDYLTENEFYKTQYESFINDTNDFVFGKTENMKRLFRHLSLNDVKFKTLIQEQKYKDLIIMFFELLDIILSEYDNQYRNLSDVFIMKELVKELNLEVSVSCNKDKGHIELKTARGFKTLTLNNDCNIFTKELRLEILDWIIRAFGNIQHSKFLVLNDIRPDVVSEKIVLGKVLTLEECLDMLDLYKKYEGKIIY